MWLIGDLQHNRSTNNIIYLVSENIVNEIKLIKEKRPILGGLVTRIVILNVINTNRISRSISSFMLPGNTGSTSVSGYQGSTLEESAKHSSLTL